MLAEPLSQAEFESAQNLAEMTIADDEETMQSCQADSKLEHCSEFEKMRSSKLDFMTKEDYDKVYAIRPQLKKWEGGVLPYELSDEFDCQERRHIAWVCNKFIVLLNKSVIILFIFQCIDYIQRHVPCVKIVPRKGEKDFVRLIASRPGCNAYQGNRGGMHEINLNRGDTCTKVCLYSRWAIKKGFISQLYFT